VTAHRPVPALFAGVVSLRTTTSLRFVPASITVIEFKALADLPRKQPVYQEAPVGKMPIGKSPIGKTPIGKTPVVPHY